MQLFTSYQFLNSSLPRKYKFGGSSAPGKSEGENEHLKWSHLECELSEQIDNLGWNRDIDIQKQLLTTFPQFMFLFFSNVARNLYVYLWKSHPCYSEQTRSTVILVFVWKAL